MKPIKTFEVAQIGLANGITNVADVLAKESHSASLDVILHSGIYNTEAFQRFI